MADDLERLTPGYWRAVQRVRQMPVPEADKLIVLADVEVVYRWERASRRAAGQRNSTSSL